MPGGRSIDSSLQSPNFDTFSESMYTTYFYIERFQ